MTEQESSHSQPGADTTTEITRAEILAAQLRTDADKLDALVKELKQEAVRIADALLEARQHGVTITFGLTDRASASDDDQVGRHQHPDHQG